MITATIALRPIGPEEGKVRGCVRQKNDGRIVAFDEKPPTSEISRQGDPLYSNAGIYILKEAALAEVAPGQKVSIEHQVFPRLAKRGLLAGHVSDSYFIDIGTPESLTRFEEDLKSKQLDLSGFPS
jgi:NDP-sugar pyrophosphorylase family protein